MNSTTARAWQRLLVASAFVALSACGGGSSEEQPTPPAAPTGLTATAAGHSRIDLAWTDQSSDETAFKIERSSTSASVGFVALHTTASNAELWGDTSVSPATHYWYRVRATTPAGDSAWSNVAEATTDPAPTSAPTDVAATATSPTTVDVSWTAPADGSPNYYDVQYRLVGGITWSSGCSVAAISCTVSFLEQSRSYQFRVIAQFTLGPGAPSTTVTATTPSGLPGAPTDVAAFPTSATTVDVSWTAPALGSPTYYDVQYRLVGGIAWSTGCTVAAVSCTVSFLEQSRAYEFRVVAYNNFGAGPPSGIATATTPSAPP
jgi:Fibronectin type III domain